MKFMFLSCVPYEKDTFISHSETGIKEAKFEGFIEIEKEIDNSMERAWVFKLSVAVKMTHYVVQEYRNKLTYGCQPYGLYFVPASVPDILKKANNEEDGFKFIA